MPGSGKSTFGQALAKAVNFEFLDLDSLIEEVEGQSIREIFSEKGELYFRQLEADTLVKTIDRKQQFVMACGGGTACFHDNIHQINSAGLSVYLETSGKTLVERLNRESESVTRPLVAGTQKDIPTFVEDTLSARKHFYEQAAITIAEGQSVEDLLQLVNQQSID